MMISKDGQSRHGDQSRDSQFALTVKTAFGTSKIEKNCDLVDGSVMNIRMLSQWAHANREGGGLPDLQDRDGWPSVIFCGDL